MQKINIFIKSDSAKLMINLKSDIKNNEILYYITLFNLTLMINTVIKFYFLFILLNTYCSRTLSLIIYII